MAAQPIACDLSVFDAAECAHHAEVGEALFGAVDTLVELPDGYEFTFVDPACWRLAAEFVDFERRCCPFFEFDLTLRDNNLVGLRLTGADGAKALLQQELLPHVTTRS